MDEQIFEELISLIINLENSKKIKSRVEKALLEGVPAVDILEKGLRIGLEKVGQRYEQGEYFLSELLFGADIMNSSMEILKPELEKQTERKKGRVVLGTVQGDIHDIGKNIFKMLAISAGFEILDLGVDVEPEKFIEKVKETEAGILAMSALLTTVLPEIKKVMNKLIESGIKNDVKVIIGGNAVTKEFAKEAKVDAAALNAVEGVKLCKEMAAK